MEHNLHGDVSKEDLELAEDLLEMEKMVDSTIEMYGPSKTAQFYVCLGYDWYKLGDEDKGSELLQKSEKICPGYFHNEIQIHINEDPDFKFLVEDLTVALLEMAKTLINSNKNDTND